jgi:glycine C-acetyltransferase
MEGKNVTSFSYCNYLGLSQNEEVKKAMVDSILKDGAGISSSPVTGGSMYMHRELEKKMAEFVGSEDCILYPLGSLANAGVIPAIVDVNDIIVIDENSHASIIDGCLLSKAKIITYKHNDMEDLQKKLKNTVGNKIIVTDGVFSMDGDIAKLDKIYELGKKYESAIFVDDAHGIGVLGEHGGGIIEHFGLQGKIDFFMGTFAKAFGIQGGFVAGKKEIIKYLRYTSRTFVFNVSLQPYMVQGILTALEIVKNGKHLRDKLWSNVEFFKTKLREAKFDILNSETPIVPIMIRDNEKTKELCKYLRENNIIVDAIFYPVVKKVNSMLRVTITAEHNIEDIENILYFLKKGQEIFCIKKIEV